MNSIQELNLNEIEEVSGGFFSGSFSFSLSISKSFSCQPVYCAPKPVYCAPKPVCQPKPSYCQPKPACGAPVELPAER